MIPTWVCYRILLYCGRWYRLRRCCRSAYWKTEQILWSLCALYALRTLQLHLRPTEYSWKVSRLRKRKATCTETWPSLLKVLDGLHHMDISESSRLLPCTIVYNMCENKSVCNLFVLIKYPWWFFWILLCYFWVVGTSWGKSPTRQRKRGKMFLQCVALIRLNDLMTSRGLQQNTMHTEGSKEHPLPVLWNSKWIPGREHNARLL